jgi:hypothetical protein
MGMGTKSRETIYGALVRHAAGSPRPRERRPTGWPQPFPKSKKAPGDAGAFELLI